MNDDEAKVLGLRAVACNGWRWLPGMQLGGIHAASRIVTTNAESGACWLSQAWSKSHHQLDLGGGRRVAWPDFRDAATLGCLLALVREAWSMPDVFAACIDGGSPSVWAPRTSRPMYLPKSAARLLAADGFSEAEALVAALEAAPTATPDP